ncbi:MAG TPA: hypothetical protein VM577_07355 [Anaerovoracaceae bacterium]|nr:hypothetical protein [Anaerovoracaceae bacterium]
MSDIKKLIDETVKNMEQSGFNMTEKDINTLTQIFKGEKTYEDIIEVLIKTEQNPEHLKMWATLRNWERDQFEFPTLKYNYEL